MAGVLKLRSASCLKSVTSANLLRGGTLARAQGAPIRCGMPKLQECLLVAFGVVIGIAIGGSIVASNTAQLVFVTGCGLVGIVVFLGGWRLFRWLWPIIPPPSPALAPPPTPLNGAQFPAAVASYADTHSKFVRPDLSLAWEAAKASIDFSKMTLTFLTVGNVGGLLAMLAIHPLVKDAIENLDRVWILQLFWPAVSFTVGAALAVISAAITYVNYLANALVRFSISEANDYWIKGVIFQLPNAWAQAGSAWPEYARMRANRFVVFTVWAGITLAVASATAWVAGVVLLINSLLAIFSG